MRADTAYEILVAAQRLLPGLRFAATAAAFCALMGALFCAVALVVILNSEPTGLTAVTDSGLIYFIPFQNAK